MKRPAGRFYTNKGLQDLKTNDLDNSANRELIRLFLEASGLVVKLTHFIEQQHPQACELHLAAAHDFIERNKLYALTLGVAFQGENKNE